MSLVTRCPACGTVFRVVQDQLKVSEGWVRCGRCSDVFNAVDGLFDLDHDNHAARGVLPGHHEDPSGFTHDERSTLGAPSPLRVDALMAAVAAAHATPEPPQGAEGGHHEQAKDAETLAAVYAHLIPGGPAAEPPLSVPADMPADSAPSVDAVAVADPFATDMALATPDFVRRADRAARWRNPLVRSALSVVSLLLALALAGQVALHYRDGLAARWPASQALLQLGCAFTGCRIDAPRRIDALSVDSSGLLRTDISGQYRLSLVLHNRSAGPVLMPAIDLALTNNLGETMIRRVLYASELGHAATTLAARSELTMHAVLDLGERQVIGYTIELFYP